MGVGMVIVSHILDWSTPRFGEHPPHHVRERMSIYFPSFDILVDMSYGYALYLIVMNNLSLTPPPIPRRLARRQPLNAKLLATNMWMCRHRMRLSQIDLARLAKTDRKTIYNIENGRSVPSVILALRIANALGQPVEELFKIQHQFDR